MMINDLINKYKNYSPYYGPGYTNHLPMTLYALYALGCSEIFLNEFSGKYIEDTDLVSLNEVSGIDRNVEGCLGQRDKYGAYVTHFEEKRKTESIDYLIRDTLNSLSLGIGSVLFHSLIRLSYAVTSKNDDEIIRGLAYFSSSYEAVQEEVRVIPSCIIRPEFMRFISERKGYFHLGGEPEEKEAVILDALCDLYIATGSFIVLHTITGFEALHTLKSYFEDYNKAIDTYTESVLKALLRVTDNDYRKIVIDKAMTFEEMKKEICLYGNSHTVKLLYSADKLYQVFKNEKLNTVVRIKLKIDHNI
jgi:hypothetical protein